MEDDGAVLLVPGTHVAATAVIAAPPSPQPLQTDDAAPSTPTIPSRPSSALTAPLALPAARTFSSTATSASSFTSPTSHDALNTSDNGLHLSGEKPVRSVTGSLQPTPSVPVSRQLSRQSSSSDAPLPSRSVSAQPQQDSARVLRVTNEALSLRKQSLRHAVGSMTPPQPIEDVHTLRALLAFQNKEIAAYKQQITTLTTDNNRLAAEVRAFPHSASEVNRVISSLREERSRMEGRIRALDGDKKVWAAQMRHLHQEMNGMEREWIKDRQRLEEAVRREEERNERLMAEWDDREERINGLLRERKREQDELDKLRTDLRDMEKRLEHSQAEYARLVSAWREERLLGVEVEGRLRGEVYARLFAVMREVVQKEAESAEWEREMGRKRDVQAGVEELEKRYMTLINAVSERDELINRLREDTRRLVTIMQEDSAVRVRSFQVVDDNNPGNTPGVSRSMQSAYNGVSNNNNNNVTAPSARVAQHAAVNSVHVKPLPFPSLDPAVTTHLTSAQQHAPLSSHPPPSPYSMPSPPLAGSATQPGNQSLNSTQINSNSLSSTTTATSTLSIPPLSTATGCPSTSASASPSPAALKSPTAYLSAFFSSAASSLIASRAEQQPAAAHTASTPRQQQQQQGGGSSSSSSSSRSSSDASQDADVG